MFGALGAVEQAGDVQDLDAWIVTAVGAGVEARAGSVGHHASDLAEADDSQRVAGQLEAGEARPNPEALAAWWKDIDGWRSKKCLKYKQGSKVIMPQFVIEKLYEVTGGDAIVTSDVGQHQMWVAQAYPLNRPRQWLTSGGLGTMGFGVPAAIGAALAEALIDRGARVALSVACF